MNKPNNRRRRESCEKIERVFIELLETKKLNQITVSDICKKAGLNRTTFYANYTDIFGLAEEIRRKLESGLSDLYQEEIQKGINTNDYLKLFRHIQANQELYRTYFRLGYDESYRIVAYDTELAEKHFGGRHIAYHMEFFKSGLTRIIKIWLLNGCRESPEEMFEIVRSEYRGRTEYFAKECRPDA